MSSKEPNLGLNYGWIAGESGWQEQVNENFRALGALTQGAVKSATITTPPVDPIPGDRYIIPVGAAAGWSEHAGKLARKVTEGWEMYSPKEGWEFRAMDTDSRWLFEAGYWREIGVAEGGGIVSITAGPGIHVDSTDPLHPVVSTSESGAGVNIQTGTSYTLVISDAFKTVYMDNEEPNTLTVPSDSSFPFPNNTRIDLGQDGEGQTTIVAGAGVTIRSPETLKLRKRWSKASLVRRAANTWDLIGDLEHEE